MRASHRPVRNLRSALAAFALAGALAGCQTTGAPGPDAAAAPEEPPMTHQRAAEQCWMATEKGHADLSLDKRADIVTKCIDEKMNGKKAAAIAPTAQPKAKPKTEIKPKAEAKPKTEAKPKDAAKPAKDDKPKDDESASPKN